MWYEGIRSQGSAVPHIGNTLLVYHKEDIEVLLGKRTIEVKR